MHKFVEDTARLSATQQQSAIQKLEKRQAKINTALLTLIKRRDALVSEIRKVPATRVGGGVADSVWSRTWTSSWGDMTMQVSGGSMTGTFTHKDGKLEGQVSAEGRKITGRWSQASTRTAPSDAGAFEFTMDPGGKQFAGKWWYGFDTSKAADGGWTGNAKQSNAPKK